MDKNKLSMFGLDEDMAHAYRPNQVVGFSGNLNGKMHPTKVEEKILSGAKSSISKDYWKVGDHSPVTFDPISKEYSDAEGNVLGRSDIERIPPSAKSVASAMSNRTYSVPGIPDLLRTNDGRYFKNVTDSKGNITREYVNSDTVRKKLATTKAGVKTYEFTTKQYDTLDTFVNNLEGNFEKIKAATETIKRSDIRLLNIPYTEFEMRIKGNPNEANLRTAYTELSTEATKIANGAQQSIAEPSAGAQDRWNKLHDANLSASDIIEVAEFTKGLALQRREGVARKLEQIGVRIDQDRGPADVLRDPRTGKRDNLKNLPDREPPKTTEKFVPKDLKSNDFKAAIKATLDEGKTNFVWKNMDISVEKVKGGIKLKYTERKN
jgi:hypothetical protein